MIKSLPRSITAQVRNADIRAQQIEAVARHLAQLMDNLHGEECRFTISHEAGEEFIGISPGMKKGGSSRD